MILTDEVHIVSTLSVAELHAFAGSAGIKRCWFHRSRNHPHYDKPKLYPAEQLYRHGAIRVVTKTLARQCCGYNTNP